MKSTWKLMIDALPSEPGNNSAAASRHLHGRLIVGAVAALLIVAGAFVWRLAASSPPAAAPAQIASAAANPAPPARNPVLDELVEATKALESSQQQAIDQLQELQQLIASQQTEARKSSAAVAALNAKLEALQQSFASLPTPAQEEVDTPRPRKSKPATARSRGKAHRVASGKTRTASRRH
jgi:septal ring factor EnvC (AmiA/AmiB activator)